MYVLFCFDLKVLENGEINWHLCSLAVPKLILPNFGNFLKNLSGIKNLLTSKIKVWKRLGKVAPGSVREGDGILVR